jgi:amidophosphoribosyltransferase
VKFGAARTSLDGMREERPREACGVLAALLPGDTAAPIIADGLHALQHRGQEAAGLGVSSGAHITVVKNVGLVTDVLNRRTIGFLEGELGIGHTRYSTTGSSTWANAQPCFRSTSTVDFALGHNGNLTNTIELVERLELDRPAFLAATNDSDVIAELLARELERDGGAGTLREALLRVLPLLEGAFSLVVMDARSIFGVRDPNGFRPLCLGRLHSGWILASETAALDAVGAEFVRELTPGELVEIDLDGSKRSDVAFPIERIDPRLCIFEFVYMARPDSWLYGRSVHGARMRMGALLARKMPVAADMVMGVPDSGLPAAEGYAEESGIRYSSGLVKNRYIGRTFINPTQGEREHNARRKLNVLSERVKGKRLVVVEDSLIRGTTTRFLGRMLREAGATEVHLRVALPPVAWPCFYGIDIGTREELLAANMGVEQIRQLVEADSLAFLTVPELRSAIGVPGGGFCDACMTNDYPTTIARQPDKLLREADAEQAPAPR